MCVQEIDLVGCDGRRRCGLSSEGGEGIRLRRLGDGGTHTLTYTL